MGGKFLGVGRRGGRDLPLQCEAKGTMGGGRIALLISGRTWGGNLFFGKKSFKSSSLMLSNSGKRNFKSSGKGSSAKKEPCWDMKDDSGLEMLLVDKVSSEKTSKGGWEGFLRK